MDFGTCIPLSLVLVQSPPTLPFLSYPICSAAPFYTHPKQFSLLPVTHSPLASHSLPSLVMKIIFAAREVAQETVHLLCQREDLSSDSQNTGKARPSGVCLCVWNPTGQTQDTLQKPARQPSWCVQPSSKQQRDLAPNKVELKMDTRLLTSKHRHTRKDLSPPHGLLSTFMTYNHTHISIFSHTCKKHLSFLISQFVCVPACTTVHVLGSAVTGVSWTHRGLLRLDSTGQPVAGALTSEPAFQPSMCFCI